MRKITISAILQGADVTEAKDSDLEIVLALAENEFGYWKNMIKKCKKKLNK